MAILKIQLIKNYFRFFLHLLKKEVFLLISVFASILLSAQQVTTIGTTEISGSENLYYKSSTGNIYALEGTLIHNFSEESEDIKVIYLKKQNKLEKTDAENQEKLVSAKQSKSSEIKKKESPVKNVSTYRSNTSEEAFGILFYSNHIATVSLNNYKANAFIDDSVLISIVYIWVNPNKIDSEIQAYSNYAQSASKIRPPPKLI